MQFKQIEGWPNYMVCSLGFVIQIENTERRRTGGIPMHPTGKSGYLQVQLIDENRREFKYVHRLVADAFLPNPNNLPVINHLDFDVQNNNIDNLQWCTQEENVHHSIKAGRRNATAKWFSERAGIIEMIKRGEGTLKIAATVGCKPQHVSRIRRKYLALK